MSARGAKESIDFVCSLLADLGVARLTSENLRQSKFNGPTSWAVWRALHDIILLITVDFVADRCDVEPFWRSVEEERAGREIPIEGRELIRKFLELHEYPRLRGWIEGRLHEVGSREVLLALGWVIMRWDVLETAFGRRFGNTSLATLLPPYPQEMMSESDACERSRENHAVDLPDWEGCEHLSQQCQRQLGRTRLKLKAVASLQTAKSRLSHRIAQLQWEFKLLGGVSQARILTPFELCLAMDPEKLASHQATLRAVLHALDEHSVFTHHATVFATWLSSVVREDMQANPSMVQGTNGELCHPIKTLEKVQGMGQVECIEAAKQLYIRAGPQLGPFLRKITSTNVRKNSFSGHFWSVLRSVRGHEKVGTGSESGASQPQPYSVRFEHELPEDIAGSLRSQDSTQGATFIECVSKLNRRCHFTYNPLAGALPHGILKPADALNKPDTITEELMRVLDSVRAISSNLANIGSTNRDQLRRCLEPFAKTHVIIGL